MTVNPHIFPEFMAGVSAGDITMGSGTWKIALSNAAGPISLSTSGVSTAKLWTDWTTNVTAEVTGTGYTSGGVTVTSPTWTIGGTNNSVMTFTSGTTPTWSSATITANQAILYQSSASTYQLAAFWDFGGAVSSTSSTYTLTINASGLLTATAS